MPHRVFAIGSVRAWTELLAEWIQQIPGFELAGTASDATAALGELAQMPRPVDIVVIDAGTRGALDAAGALRRSDPPRKLFAIGLADDAAQAMAWAGAGATGLMGRGASIEQLCQGLVEVSRGAEHCCGEISAALLRGVGARGGRPTHEHRLTDREHEVARLMGRGLTNKEIGSHLHIAPGTVKTHVHNVIRKLGVRRAFVGGTLGHGSGLSMAGACHGPVRIE